ncbi:MAG: hypothetical protein ACI4RM_06235 [Ruminococcus sp.]
MLQKHIKAVSLVLALCLVAVMFMIVALTGYVNMDASNPVSLLVLLLFVSVAAVPVFAAHEKHD